MGKRALAKSRPGTMARTASRSSSSASAPIMSMAFPRRAKASRWASEWHRLSTPRWLNMTLKSSSAESPSQSLRLCS